MSLRKVELLDTHEVQGVELTVENGHGDVFVIRKFRRSRGDYYVVRHPQSGAHERFASFEKAKGYMSASHQA
jgi:hypothetical protein